MQQEKKDSHQHGNTFSHLKEEKKNDNFAFSWLNCNFSIFSMRRWSFYSIIAWERNQKREIDKRNYKFYHPVWKCTQKRMLRGSEKKNYIEIMEKIYIMKTWNNWTKAGTREAKGSVGWLVLPFIILNAISILLLLVALEKWYLVVHCILKMYRCECVCVFSSSIHSCMQHWQCCERENCEEKKEKKREIFSLELNWSCE